jgi:hypothetical protein
MQLSNTKAIEVLSSLERHVSSSLYITGVAKSHASENSMPKGNNWSGLPLKKIDSALILLEVYR